MRKGNGKGPRLWFRKPGHGRAGVWLILDDDGFQRSTGCGADARGQAEAQLQAYLAEKHRPSGGRRPDEVFVADALNLYLRDVAPKHRRPHETGQRVAELLTFWNGKRLSDIIGETCRAYAAERTPAAARRQLEDLRAAVKHWQAEKGLDAVPIVTLPDKSPPRPRWLTRSQVARLLWAAWRAREVQEGEATRRWTRRHVARFILIAFYTGTRSGAICAATWTQFDLHRERFYRRPEDEAEIETKRRPPVRIPPRLLAHMRRWRRLDGVMTHPIHFRGSPVGSIKKAFARCAEDAKLVAHPHMLRHTTATHLMQNGAKLWDAAGFLGMTVETLEEVYGHHHVDFQSDAAQAISHKGRTKNAASRD